MRSPTDLIAALSNSVVPAVLTPLGRDGRPHFEALSCYADAILGAPIGGVAVCAHTSRALYLDEASRGELLRRWRDCSDLPIVAGAGVPMSTDAGDLVRAGEETVRMACQAARLGADVAMVYPPAALRDRADRFERLLDLHDRVAAESGLAVLGFHLHTAAGGYTYSRQFLDELLRRPSVIGVKTATLDRAVDCQETLAACRSAGKLAVTGEDRMFGPSYMWGANAALVGIAAAAVNLSCRVANSWAAADHSRFILESERLDRFAAVAFEAPIDGYIQRMMWVAVAEGILDEDAAHDPFGPALAATERARVVQTFHSLRANIDC